MIHYRCPHCGESISVADDRAGRELACGLCGRASTVPSPEPTPAPPAPPPASIGESRDAERAAKRAAIYESMRQGDREMARLTGLLAVALVPVGWLWFAPASLVGFCCGAASFYECRTKRNQPILGIFAGIAAALNFIPMVLFAVRFILPGF